MPTFDLDCGRIEEIVEITYGGHETRGHADFRGFSCAHAAACEAAGIECQLFALRGYRPFEPRDAFEHFDS
jgi:hypothetical protein